MLNFLFGSGYGYGYAPGTRPLPTGPLPSTAVGQGQFSNLQHRVDTLELACAALWRLLKEKNGLTDEELKAMIHTIDGEDGAVDGRIQATAGSVCPVCGHRILSRTAGKCLWCGAEIPTPAFGS